MERAMLSEQGVVFDTGDETNSEMKITLGKNIACTPFSLYRLKSTP